jgi:hypothetical protein
MLSRKRAKEPANFNSHLTWRRASTDYYLIALRVLRHLQARPTLLRAVLDEQSHVHPSSYMQGVRWR